MKNVVYSALIVLFFIVLLSCWMIYRHLKESEDQADQYKALANLVSQKETAYQEPTEDTAAEPSENQEHTILPEYVAVYEKNPDTLTTTEGL